MFKDLHRHFLLFFFHFISFTPYNHIKSSVQFSHQAISTPIGDLCLCYIDQPIDPHWHIQIQITSLLTRSLTSSHLLFSLSHSLSFSLSFSLLLPISLPLIVCMLQSFLNSSFNNSSSPSYLFPPNAFFLPQIHSNPLIPFPNPLLVKKYKSLFFANAISCA